MAAGTTLPFVYFYVPVNIAVEIANGGPRLTTLAGWIVGLSGCNLPRGFNSRPTGSTPWVGLDQSRSWGSCEGLSTA